MHRRGPYGRRRTHRAQISAGAGSASARPAPQGGRGGVQRAFAGVRRHAERDVAGVAALYRRRGRRAQVPLQAGQLLHGTAVHEPSVQRAGSLKCDWRGRRIGCRRGRSAAPQDGRPTGDERVQRRRRVAGPRRRRRGLVGRAKQRTVGRRGCWREMRPRRRQAQGLAARMHWRNRRRRPPRRHPRAPRAAQHAARQAAHTTAAHAAHAASRQAAVVRVQYRAKKLVFG